MKQNNVDVPDQLFLSFFLVLYTTSDTWKAKKEENTANLS